MDAVLLRILPACLIRRRIQNADAKTIDFSLIHNGHWFTYIVSLNFEDKVVWRRNQWT